MKKIKVYVKRTGETVEKEGVLTDFEKLFAELTTDTEEADECSFFSVFSMRGEILDTNNFTIEVIE